LVISIIPLFFRIYKCFYKVFTEINFRERSGGVKPEIHGSTTFREVWRGKAGNPRQYNFRRWYGAKT
jgi:hypothetical protein